MGRDDGPREDAVSSLPGELLAPTLKAKLMERIRTEERLRPHRGRGGGKRLPLASIAFGLSLALAVVLAIAWTRARHEVARLTSELGASQAETAQLRGRIAGERASELAWMRDPGVRLAVLSGKGSAAEARARLFYSPKAQEGLLWVHGLPQLPKSRSYQLWAFLGTLPSRVGVFEVKGSAPAVVTIQDDDLGGASRFAVSVEPSGGGPVPTGEVVLLGEVPGSG